MYLKFETIVRSFVKYNLSYGETDLALPNHEAWEMSLVQFFLTAKFAATLHISMVTD
jgi:hypothetical protein